MGASPMGLKITGEAPVPHLIRLPRVRLVQFAFRVLSSEFRPVFKPNAAKTNEA